ncbi:hypothetical protein ACFL09_03180 [Planctomycetota bacterium]
MRSMWTIMSAGGSSVKKCIVRMSAGFTFFWAKPRRRSITAWTWPNAGSRSLWSSPLRVGRFESVMNSIRRCGEAVPFTSSNTSRS